MPWKEKQGFFENYGEHRWINVKFRWTLKCFYWMFTGVDLVVCDIPIKFVWLAIYKWDIWIQSIWLPCASFLPIANHMNWLFIHFRLLPHHAISTSILENPRNFGAVFFGLFFQETLWFFRFWFWPGRGLGSPQPPPQTCDQGITKWDNSILKLK